MTGQERAIRSVAVIGGGPVGWSAALAFARALPQVAVTIVETTDSTARDLPPVYLTPSNLLDGLPGFDERSLLHRGATHRLAARFDDWSASGAPWFLALGDYGAPMGSIPFHQLWARARRDGHGLPYDHYAAAAVMAEAGRFVHPQDDVRSPLSTYDYMLRVPPAVLVDAARRAGMGRVERRSGAILDFERDADGRVARLAIGDAAEPGWISADLFLDCEPGAPLLSRIGGAFEPWSDLVPIDWLRVGAAPSVAPDPLDRIRATPDGWTWAIPAGDRQWTVEAGSGAPLAGGDATPIRPGRVRDPWIANVLALGDAALASDGLGATTVWLAHRAIRRALELLPGRDCRPLELREYNRRWADETMRVRDFTALRYLRSGRRDGELWQRAARQPLPESLARTLHLFESRGRLPFFEDDPQREEAWLAALIGLGLLPRATDPIADAVPLAASLEWMDSIARGFAALPARLPAYTDYLAQCSR